MPPGGKRKGSGRKSTWKSGCKFEDTKLIRVPKAIADELLCIAHKLDKGESLDLETKSMTQLNLLDSSPVIGKETRLSGVQLGTRLGVSSASLTPHKNNAEVLAKYTQERDPDKIPWAREGRKYRPLLS